MYALMNCPKETQKYFEFELISELRKRFGKVRVSKSSEGGECVADPNQTTLCCYFV